MNKENPMISVDEALGEISKFYLILSEGERGHHILFTPEMIRMTFEKNTDELSKLFHANLDEINKILNQSLMFKTLDEKKDLIESLSTDLQRALIYGYFQLLEGQRSEKPVIH